MKKVCFQAEILGNLFKYIFFVLFFCVLPHLLAVRVNFIQYPLLTESRLVNYLRQTCVVAIARLGQTGAKLDTLFRAERTK